METIATPVFNAEQTAELLDFPGMVSELKRAAQELALGAIQAPERQAVEFPQGGIMLSMPATADDIGIHKLVNVVTSNAGRGLPVIHGVVAAYDGQTGRELCILHGQTVTARRTAAVSMLGLEVLSPKPPAHVTIIGYGSQAAGHAQALASLYPGLRVSVTGRNPDKARHFVDSLRHLELTLDAAAGIPDDTDTVITVTSSTQPVYNQPAVSGRLVIAVGAFRPDMAEIGSTTLQSSRLYVDEPTGARHEAGDYIQANVDWNGVCSIVQALQDGVDFDQPAVYKTVGCAAWDLAAARAALKNMDRP